MAGTSAPANIKKRKIIDPTKVDKNAPEEPVVVAQRFINIFRQLHVFSEEMRLRYDNMLLEIPSDVEMMFEELPGGSALSDYLKVLQNEGREVVITSYSIHYTKLYDQPEQYPHQ